MLLFFITLIGWQHSSFNSYEDFQLWDSRPSESSHWSSHSHRSCSPTLNANALSSFSSGSARFIFLLPQTDLLARPTVNSRDIALTSHLQILYLNPLGVWETANEKCTSVRQSKMPGLWESYWVWASPKLSWSTATVAIFKMLTLLGSGMVHCYIFWPSPCR